MTPVEIEVQGDALVVRTPRTRAFVVFALAHGAKWDREEAWVFRRDQEADVRRFCRALQQPLPAPAASAPVASPGTLAEVLAMALDPGRDLVLQLRTLGRISTTIDAASARADEIEQLAAAFESMAERLRRTAQARSHAPSGDGG